MVLGRECVVGFCWVIVLCSGCGVLVGVEVCGIGCMCGGGVWDLGVGRVLDRRGRGKGGRGVFWVLG